MTSPTSGHSNLWLARIAAVGGASWFLAHSLAVIFGPEQAVMRWLYDDAFYYLITAKHLSERHLSSFDGITLTSGYHPLWLWLCSLLYGLRSQLDLTYVRCCMALSFTITAAVLLLTLRHAWVRNQQGMLWAIAMGASSYSALNNGITAMEWPLVLLSWFLLHHLLLRSLCDQPAPWLAAAVVGFAGTLSRTDFGLIPACYFAAALLLGIRYRSWQPARSSAAALLGAALGLPVVFLYNYRMTGTWLQSSAQVKHLAASLSSPFNPVPAMWQFLRVLLYLPSLDFTAQTKELLLHRALLPASLALLALAVWLGRRAWQAFQLPPSQRTDIASSFAIAASSLGILAFLALDGLNTQATYGWYTGAVTGFILILAARFLSKLKTPTAALTVIPLMVANIAAAQWFGGNATSQMQEVYVGKAMHLQHPDAVMGGGDVGKPAFYNNGTMFNLDGLMNNEVVPYLGSGRIHCYILHRHIAYLSDIGTITKPITDAERARHGETPLPWSLYFTPVVGPPVDDSPPDSSNYLKTDFEAIRASGECPSEQ